MTSLREPFFVRAAYPERAKRVVYPEQRRGEGNGCLRGEVFNLRLLS